MRDWLILYKKTNYLSDPEFHSSNFFAFMPPICNYIRERHTRTPSIGVYDRVRTCSYTLYTCFAAAPLRAPGPLYNQAYLKVPGSL